MTLCANGQQCSCQPDDCDQRDETRYCRIPFVAELQKALDFQSRRIAELEAALKRTEEHWRQELNVYKQTASETVAPQRMKYFDAPLGTRFHYIDSKDVWVKISNADYGIVAKWDGVIAKYVGQSICSFAETRKELETLEVEIVERTALPTEASPVAYVPLHPVNGPLWANTIPNLDSDHPRSYELMPVYAQPQVPPTNYKPHAHVTITTSGKVTPVEPPTTQSEVPKGHFWHGEINRFFCRHCGHHHDAHLHSNEASLCPQFETDNG